MRMYVFHKKHSDFFTVPDTVDLAEYDLVARVEADELEDAYRLTNNIDWSWTENPEVLWHKPLSKERAGIRSTSVGDVICTAEGLFVVDRVGFKELEVRE